MTLLEPPSPTSSDFHREDLDEILLVGSSHAISPPSDDLSVTSSRAPHLRERLYTITVETRLGRSIFKTWLQSKRDSDGTPYGHKPGQRSGKSRQPDDPRPPSDSSMGIDATNEGPSTMAVSALPWRAIGYGVSDIS